MEPGLNTYSTASLAYLCDCVLELCVRQHLVRSGLSSSQALNKKALDFVRATAQAEAMKRLMPHLSEEEAAVFRRGRNIGHTNTPKSATVAEYRAATGMEALFGWLHLAGRGERIDELFSLAYDLSKSNES
jgi:ribonuclease-3 family protein